jgi:hypothetical protein
MIKFGRSGQVRTALPPGAKAFLRDLIGNRQSGHGATA